MYKSSNFQMRCDQSYKGRGWGWSWRNYDVLFHNLFF